uniref:ARAD1C24640p n=1 Tax=Blastobotrys adeninivorans TaxID=409370 RepID=A0A060T1X8_BLAAD
MRSISIIPKAFLLAFPLHLGVELIIGLGALNKASGFYGFLSIFTGHPLSAVEWVLNSLSLAFLPLFIIVLLNFKNRNALEMVLFAYVYTIDTMASMAFAIYFCVHWFVSKAAVVAASGSASGPATNTSALSDAMATMASAAASSVTSVSEAVATAVSTNVESAVESITEAISTSVPTAVALEATAVVERAASLASMAASSATSVASGAVEADEMNKSASLAQETAVTIVITVGLILTRIYFTLVVLAYARQLVHQQNLRPHNHNGAAQGTLPSKIQRVALSIFPYFWMGSSGYSSLPTKPSAAYGKQSEGTSLTDED